MLPDPARFTITRKLILLVFAGMLAGSPIGFSPTPAQAFGVGTLGWCTVLMVGGACYSTPGDACQAQHDSFAPTQAFYGYTDTGRWDYKQCQWHTGLGIIYPAAVSFQCVIGWSPHYSPLPPGNCVADDENAESRPPDDNGPSCGAASTNNGSNTSPFTKHPIEIATGAKFFRSVDFKTADGSLSLERVYNSKSYGNQAGIMRRAPWGTGNGWRFAFQHELHLYAYGETVELETPGGGSYQFNRSSGVWVANQHGYSLPKQTDYTLEFVGTYPSSWSSVLSASTQWRVTDSEDRVWLFQTYLDYGSNQYAIALPISVTFRGGLGWTLSYGSHHELSSITDSYGKTISFNWNLFDPSTLGAIGLPIVPVGVSSATVPDGTTFKYIFDAVAASGVALSDRLITVEHRDASNNLLDSTTYLYENSDFPFHVTGIKDSSSTRRWTVEYDTHGRAVTSKGPNDADKYTISYGTPSSTVTRTVTNALGKDTVYTFSWGWWDIHLQSINGSASAHCPASTQTYAVDSSTKFITSVTDAEGRVTTYTRESRGLPTQIVDGYGTSSARTTNITWHSTLRMPTQTVQPGLTTDFTWNSAGQLTQVTQTDTTTQTVPYSTNGQARTWAYTYDSYGHLLTVDGPLGGTGDTVTYTYDSSGYLAAITNEVGHVLTVSAVNGRGQPTTIVDANNVTTTLTYDSEGRLKTSTVDPSGAAAITSIDYNVVGDITKITRPNGAYLQYTWDDGRRLTKVQDNTGASVEYDRNAFGNVTARRIKDAGSTTLLSQTATFDELGRLLTFVGAATQTWTHAYDKTDNEVSVTDPRANVHGRAFDSLSRLIRETDEDSHQVNLTLNGKDEVTAYSDPRSLNTTYVRDGFGDVIRRSSPDTGTTDSVYNALGKVTQVTDARGVVTNLTYDNAGRLLTKQYPAATGENITITWDSTTSGNKGVGRITRIDDASGSVEYSYNVLGQITQETKTTSSVVYSVAYAYDLDGKITQITYPSGRIVNYSRDSLGRISGVTTQKDSGSATVTLASSVTYQPFGPLNSLTYGSGLVLTKTFTSDYLLNALQVQDTVTSTVVVNRSHAFGDNINLTGITDNITSTRNESYTYTPGNRLQEGVGIWGTLDWSYDSTGNRSSEALTSGSTTTSTYNYPTSSNKLSTVTQGASTVRSFSYDGVGNITADSRSGTSYNYRYNNRNRLDQLTIGTTVTANYIYDGLERLAIRTTQNMTPAGTTHYVYDLAGHLIAESTDTGTTVREYAWLDDLPLAVVADVDTISPNLYFVHADHLDRPIKMTDTSEAVVWDAIYKPFGEVQSISGAASNNLRFPGQYFLIEDGLHYNWYRHYDPTIGRYLQADPVEFMDGPSVYAYAKSSPQQLVDPEGRAAQICLLSPALCAQLVTKTVEMCLVVGAAVIAHMARPQVDKEECDKMHYEIDIPTCRGIERRRGKQAAQRCYASAAERYSACLTGKPLPPLDVWNN